MWIDDLRMEMQSRQAGGEPYGADLRRPQAAAADEAVARADALVRMLLNQMNQTLLGGRGSVWDAPARWGVHLWELWWEPTREGGPYLVVTLLRDSRGTPYLRVQGRRLALADARLERRLQRALRAAFLEPRSYAPRRSEVLSSLPLGIAGAAGRLPHPMADVPPRPAGAETAGRDVEPRTRRRGRRDSRDD